jgi:hypothetical protein
MPAYRFLRKWQICLIVLAFSYLATASLADDLDNIRLEGVIRDATGAIVMEAKVQVRDTATGIERSVETDAEGRSP